MKHACYDPTWKWATRQYPRVESWPHQQVLVDREMESGKSQSVSEALHLCQSPSVQSRLVSPFGKPQLSIIVHRLYRLLIGSLPCKYALGETCIFALLMVRHAFSSCSSVNFGFEANPDRGGLKKERKYRAGSLLLITISFSTQADVKVFLLFCFFISLRLSKRKGSANEHPSHHVRVLLLFAHWSGHFGVYTVTSVSIKCTAAKRMTYTDVSNSDDQLSTRRPRSTLRPQSKAQLPTGSLTLSRPRRCASCSVFVSELSSP